MSIKTNNRRECPRFDDVVSKKEVFNTDKYYPGKAIRVCYHTGETYDAIILDVGYDYIQCQKVSIKGEVTTVEIELEEYLSGTWVIKSLSIVGERHERRKNT